MFRLCLSALIVSANFALADEIDISDIIANDGLAAAESKLADTTAATAFALGSVRFLRAIEKSLQLRYRFNADFSEIGLPVLRLPLPANENAEDPKPSLVADLFRTLDTDMALVRETLSVDSEPFGVRIDLSKIWFDINMNGQRDDGESAIKAFSFAFDAAISDQTADLIVRFDIADTAWLRAYTHLLSGISNLVLAYDPTDVIADVQSGSKALNALRDSTRARSIFMSPNDENFVDLFAMAYGALNTLPNKAHTQAAHAHFIQMIEDNFLFWEQVAVETDNTSEWIPNAMQDAALGFDLPADTGPAWTAVLSDAKAVLQGELLISHWRIGPDAGVNVAKFLENPAAVDIVTWVQGYGLLDYMEKGPTVSSENLRRIQQMFGGNALLYMVLLN